jgi:hypothetical protein
MIKLKRFNKDIGSYKQYYNFEYDVNLTDHADQRRTRSDLDRTGQKPITNDEILTALKKSNPKLVSAIISNDINVGTKGRFIIQVKSTGLKLVCSATKVDDKSDTIKITVITCGRFGNEFKNEGNTFVIEI